MRAILTALSVIALLVLDAHLAFAEKRVALIIGNSAYQNISRLDNPSNDARLMETALSEVGFEVIVATDADFNAMRRAIREFGRELRAAGKDTVGLFYYAGHGVQSKGRNYLIPLTAQIDSEADLAVEAISTAQVLAQMEVAGNRLNLVILDSCRNNPFKSAVRSGSRGLARIDTASGTLVAFSAGPGQVAIDGQGSNSPYTAALAEFIKQPNLSVEQVFKRVRNRVEDASGGKQTPWEESSLRGDFYFAGNSVDATAAQNGQVDESAFELSFWETIKTSNNARDFEEYLKTYPQGRFTGLAKLRIERLKKQQQAAVTTVPLPKTMTPAVQDPPVHQCDRLAAHPRDRQRRTDGVSEEVLEKQSVPAIAACRQAVATYPGIARFEMQLGRALYAGKSYAEASRRFQKARELGNSYGAYSLARIYQQGLGVEKNPGKAIELFMVAADNDHPQAPNSLGVAYTNGTGVSRDLVEARRWYKLGAERGDDTARANLALMYIKGRGGPKDERAALSLVRKAAAQNNAQAINILGAFHEFGLADFRKNRVKAIQLYRKSAMLGYGTAVENLDRLGVPAYDPIKIQKLLAKLGYDPGPIDGKPGQKTRTAIQAFQRDRGFQVDGKASLKLFLKLRKVAHPNRPL